MAMVIRRTIQIPDRSFSLVRPVDDSGRTAILKQAFSDVTATLLDFADEIEEARTSAEADSIARLLKELREKVGAMEDRALAASDRLGNGNVA